MFSAGSLQGLSLDLFESLGGARGAILEVVDLSTGPSALGAILEPLGSSWGGRYCGHHEAPTTTDRKLEAMRCALLIPVRSGNLLASR
eukprot:8496967-Pyramimonas_sp.AAC.1